MHTKLKTAALAGGLALVGGIVVALPAGASTACGFDNGVVTMAVAGGDNLAITAGAQGDLLFNGQPCATATVANTTEVDLSSTGGDQGITFDLTGGPFSAAPDAPDVSFHLALDDGGNDYDRVTVQGTGGNDHVVAGSNGINLDADEPQPDVDVVAPGIDSVDLVGGDGADVLSGNGGGATGGPAVAPYIAFEGEGGNDQLTGSTDAQTSYNFYEPGSGDDDIDAVAGGYDEISFGNSQGGVHVDLASGTATGDGTDSFTPDSFYYVFGSSFDDTLLGDSSGQGLNGSYGDDVIDGRGGQDQVYGDAGDDTIHGGGDSDNLFPGAGDDVIHGGAGKDSAFFGVGGNVTSGVTVDVPNGTVTGEGADAVDSDIEAYLGTSLADTFLGTEGHDEFYGSNGNDKLYGKGGADYLSGGADNDTLNGGKGSPDTCYQDGGKGSTGGCEIKS